MLKSMKITTNTKQHRDKHKDNEHPPLPWNKRLGSVTTQELVDEDPVGRFLCRGAFMERLAESPTPRGNVFRRFVGPTRSSTGQD